MEILDIGCGNGRMLELLHKHFSKSTFYGIEPSLPLHQYILDKSFKIHLIKSNFDDCVLNRTFDLIICMGVDYLFLDHNKAMLKILQMMKPFGGLYIERNVFLEMKSFVGSKINSKEELFWGNVLINTWFTEKQMEAQLEKYFEIKDKLIYGEECSKQVGWLCVPKNNTD
jgi:trans-aconitate methyltransferase